MPGEQALRRIVALALDEDLDSDGDITSRAIFGADDRGAARIITREACTVSGMKTAAETCLQVDLDLAWLPLVTDGARIPAGAEAARIEGRLVSILSAERTVLNFLSRLSGIATLTAAYVAAISSTKARIAATRKTSPGLRLLEKQAVVDAGGLPHRAGLYDAVLIKDNHIAAAGGIGKSVEAVRKTLGNDVEIEVEVETADELDEAIDAGVQRVLLDNMSAPAVGECCKMAAGRGIVVEASGGIELTNIMAYAVAGADIISVGALTRSAPGVDFSLEMSE